MTLLASALLISREDLVGESLAGLGALREDYATSEADNVFRWASWVRGRVLDHILIAPLHVAVDEAQGWVSLWHCQPTAGPTPTDPPEFKAADSRLIFTTRRPAVGQFRDQLPDLMNAGSLRSERSAEILAQTEDILPYMAMVIDLQPERRRWTGELIEAYYRAVLAVEMRFKNALGARRPVEFSAQIQPMIQTPGHSSYPSGHGTEAFALAYLLANLAERRPWPDSPESGADEAHQTDVQALVADQLFQHATRIAENRVIAGVHFPVDNMAGAGLGLAVGRYLVDRLKRAAANVTSARPPHGEPEDDMRDWRVFDPRPEAGGDAADAARYQPEVYWAAALELSEGAASQKAAAGAEGALGELWVRAAGEWNDP